MKKRIISILCGILGFAMLYPAGSDLHWAFSSEGPGVHFGDLPSALIMAAIGGGLLVAAAWIWSCAMSANQDRIRLSKGDAKVGP
jgi:hypothetical protein